VRGSGDVNNAAGVDGGDARRDQAASGDNDGVPAAVPERWRASMSPLHDVPGVYDGHCVWLVSSTLS